MAIIRKVDLLIMYDFHFFFRLRQGFDQFKSESHWSLLKFKGLRQILQVSLKPSSHCPGSGPGISR